MKCKRCVGCRVPATANARHMRARRGHEAVRGAWRHWVISGAGGRSGVTVEGVPFAPF